MDELWIFNLKLGDVKILKLVVVLAILTVLTVCWIIGDYIYYESAHYTFVNETEYDV